MILLLNMVKMVCLINERLVTSAYFKIAEQKNDVNMFTALFYEILNLAIDTVWA